MKEIREAYKAKKRKELSVENNAGPAGPGSTKLVAKRVGNNDALN